jgi:hypothetical protein
MGQNERLHYTCHDRFQKTLTTYDTRLLPRLVSADYANLLDENVEGSVKKIPKLCYELVRISAKK